jgi:hypothetical protein
MPTPQEVLNYLSVHWQALLLVTAWTISWKGIALWKAAQNKSKPWFIALLLINTLGILEIIYIYIILPMLKRK